MNSDFLNELNIVQKEAVAFSGNNLLVLAGAGSGKTRVLVYRIAWLLSQGVDLNSILAVTFTNKAAYEMKARLETMLERPLHAMWIGTFHGLANRLLRIHWQEAGFSESFQIIDAEDQARLIKRIHKTLGLDPDKWQVKQLQSYINQKKEQGVRASAIKASNFLEETLVKVYYFYEDLCKRGSLVDFAELLLSSYELWQKHPSLHQQYQNKFRYLLVDEFQDTSTMQYAWVKALYGLGASLTAVGDDDQSIYSWRGANSRNMQRLKSDYNELKVIKLEQNYRSTANILEAANAVIDNNDKRLGKKLWTDAKGGEPIAIYAAFNEIDEARYLVNRIKDWFNQGNNLDEVAILYRSNAQSRVLEEQLLQADIAYRIYGGIRFFERSEIKDVIAYLRLLINREDDASFERVVNLPVRGVGEVALDAIREYARANGLSLWASVVAMREAKQLSGRVDNALGGFLNLIGDLALQVVNLSLDDLIGLVIEAVGLLAHYVKPQYAEYKQSKLENLDELITAAKQFVNLIAEVDNKQVLLDFLTHVSLESGERSSGNDARGVNLMTLHAAKGLEFKLVFLCGMEEGLFPHMMSMKDKDDLEEERRLCYVGMTRAREKLYLSYAESRQIRGVSSFCRPSRFLREIPSNLISGDTIVKQSFPTSSSSFDNNFGVDDNFAEFSLGQNVFHSEFGEGVILGFEGQGEYMLVKVKFKHYGSKLLSLKYAGLKKI